jgi:hypothetical protein
MGNRTRGWRRWMASPATIAALAVVAEVAAAHSTVWATGIPTAVAVTAIARSQHGHRDEDRPRPHDSGSVSGKDVALPATPLPPAPTSADTAAGSGGQVKT